MRILKNLLITLVILWGLLALMVRSATPLIADYREELAGLLSEQLGAAVTIESLKARWYGIAPLLELHGVTIGEATQALAIDRLSLDLALGELLAGSPLDALRLTVDGMQLTVVREATGQLHLEGVGLIRQDADRPGIFLLPSGLRLVNTRVIWIDRRAGKPPFTIDNIDIVLDRDGSLLDLRARLETASGNADLSAQLDGFLTTRDWEGKTYLKVDNLDVADLFAQYLPTHYGLDSLHIDLESWDRWHNAAPVETHGSFELRDLRLHPKTEDALPLDLARASARFSLQRAPGDLRIGLKGLQLKLGDHQWPAGDLAFALSSQPDGARRMRVAADYLRLDDLIKILQVRLPWQDDLREPIEQLQPRGEIRDLRLLANVSADKTDWRAKADFAGLATAPWGDVPGVENLSGGLHGQQDHLVLQLDSRDAIVRFEELFRDPLELVELQGRLDILRDGDHWQVLSDRLVANTPHIDTRTRLALEQRPEQPLFLDLQTDFNDGDAAYALRYYPTAIMGAEVVGWLDTSIKSGRVPGGTALVYGSLADFPYETPSSGTFQVVFDTGDLELHYFDGWPKLEHLDARVKFHGNRLDIDVEKAAVYDSQVIDTRARIDSLTPASPLRVQGKVAGPLSNILRLLQEDALRDDFGDIVAPLRAKGNADLVLGFEIPMSEQDAYKLEGQLLFGGSELSVPDRSVAMSDIRGTLNFDLDGLSAKGIKARSLGAPVQVDVSHQDSGGTRVRARGRLKLEDIRRQVPSIPLQVISGASDFVIDMDVPPTSAPKGSRGVLSVNSDLKGIRIALPAPFGKAADEARPLAVRLPISGQPAPGDLSYADQVNARFSSTGDRVDIVLGGGEARLTPAPGIRIGGQLGKVDLLEWSEALKPLAIENTGSPGSLNLDLQIEQLGAERVFIGDLQLRASLADGLWQGVVEAPNLAGKFVAPQELTQAPVQVDLQRLSLKLPLGDNDLPMSPLPNPDSGPDPSTLPGLVLNIADLRVNDANLGQLRLNAQHAPEGLRFTQLSLRGGQLELDSAGHWSVNRTRYETEWGGFVSAADLGDLLVDLGYSRQVEQAASKIEFLLRWPGDPAQFHRATISGNVALDVGSGRIVELDPGVTRVVGLLNLNALTRRLRLDFSDIYKKGYSFDSIKGDFGFGSGKATASNLRVLGPTGRIDLDGKADLVNRTLDQQVTVTPNLDATLPIAGTLAGGPIAGLAVLVAQRLMNKQVDELNRFEYSLTGPWNEPEVRQLDSGGTLSKILQPFSGTPEKGPALEDAATKTESPESTNKIETTAPPRAKAGAAAKPQKAEEEPPEQETRRGNPFGGLLDVLKNSKPHGADIPGTSD